MQCNVEGTVEKNVDTNPLIITPPFTNQPANESNFEVEDKGPDDKVSSEAPKQSEAPSGEATSAQEVQTFKDKILVDSGKKIESVFPWKLTHHL